MRLVEESPVAAAAKRARPSSTLAGPGAPDIAALLAQFDGHPPLGGSSDDVMSQPPCDVTQSVGINLPLSQSQEDLPLGSAAVPVPK